MITRIYILTGCNFNNPSVILSCFISEESAKERKKDLEEEPTGYYDYYSIDEHELEDWIYYEYE